MGEGLLGWVEWLRFQVRHTTNDDDFRSLIRSTGLKKLVVQPVDDHLLRKEMSLPNSLEELTIIGPVPNRPIVGRALPDTLLRPDFQSAFN